MTDPMSLTDLVAVVRDGGVLGLLIVIIFGGMRQWYVWGWQYRELLKDKNEWKELAMLGSGLADKAVSVVRGNRS